MEAENLAYAKANNITICGCSRCSYFLRKDTWNDIFQTIDKKHPEFKVQFVRGLEDVDLQVEEPPQRILRECSDCGEPTDLEFCASCRLRKMAA